MTYPLSDSYNTRFNVPKPPLPYIVGEHLSIRSHIPPPHSGPDRRNCMLSGPARDERRYVDPVQRCVLHPPAPGQFASGMAEVEIVDLLQAGDPQSKQIVTVRVLSHSENSALPLDSDLVAKIYDPLYFDHEQDDTDPFLFVEEEYSRESAVYKALSDLQGTLIPKYYGSFSLSLPFPAGWEIDGSREVRLILIELICGTPMNKLDPSGFSQTQRQLILKLVVDVESLLYERNIIHKDLHPRNFVIREEGLSEWKKKASKTAPRIVLIDFGRCGIGRALVPEREKPRLPGVWISPLLRWGPKPRGKFDDWIDWNWKTWLEATYKHTKCSITDHMQRQWGYVFG